MIIQCRLCPYYSCKYVYAVFENLHDKHLKYNINMINDVSVKTCYKWKENIILIIHEL